MKPEPRLFHSRVLAVAPYRLVDEEAAVKLNQNESPYDIAPEVKEEVFARLRSRGWNRYAQKVPGRVVELLARQNDWPCEGIVLGGGSNLLLEAITFGTVGPGRNVLFPAPCFALYRLLSELAGATYATVPFGEGFAYDGAAWLEAVKRIAPDLTFLCVPNNPTGSFMGREAVTEIAAAAPGLVVVDEAYREFAGEDRRDILPDFHSG